jgi:hydroxymethylpyrimidine pyrophosphatase-like HAD family hydrolase
MLKKFLFADLDDTLFQTLEKCAVRDALEPAAYYSDGRICSYTTPAQRAFFAFASEGMTVIPTTARSLDAFRRVNLGFSGVGFTSYVVLNFGGVILLPDGRIDRDWQGQMHAQMTAALAGLEALAAHVNTWAEASGYGGRARLVEDAGTPFFIVVKDPDKIHDNLARIERELVLPWIADGHGDYCVHRNGNNLAILPRSLDKAHAVAYVIERLRREHGDIITFGMGDSRSDARFMADCDYAIIPRRTQLASLTVEAL